MSTIDYLKETYYQESDFADTLSTVQSFYIRDDVYTSGAGVNLKIGGVLTGEHGVGQGKRKYMLKELGNAVEVMKKVKNAFDPKKIMNPGKLFL